VKLLPSLRHAVAAAIEAGASEAAAGREVTLPQYAAPPCYVDWISFNIRSAYRYLRRS
jgi:cyclase